MKADMLVTAVYRHPRERVWAALTSSAALILQGGAPRIYGERLPAYLDALAGRPARPVEVRCAEGWRAYLRILRPWRAAGGQGG